jgi:hypothetical protein
MRYLIVAAALLVLLVVPSCTVKNGYLKGPNGDVVHCKASGYGIVPAIMEANSFDDCMQHYRSQGYVDQ